MLSIVQVVGASNQPGWLERCHFLLLSWAARSVPTSEAGWYAVILLSCLTIALQAIAGMTSCCIHHIVADQLEPTVRHGVNQVYVLSCLGHINFTISIVQLSNLHSVCGVGVGCWFHTLQPVLVLPSSEQN